jgi:NAD(P)-dependent dehydrogenase (short-subunit alcohol dehydrogenase family)
MKRLDKKVAVIYGNGSVGAAVAKAFAREGAKVFLAGRTASKLHTIAKEIHASGGVIETIQLDALDEKEVESHMDEVTGKAGRVDISFNAIGIPQKGIQGLPFTELSVENFFLPVSTYSQSHFITARAAARRMNKQGNGVIMMHTPNASRISFPYVGGMTPAWSAIEGLCRSLSVECGPHGVRTVCLLTTAILGTPLIDEVFDIQGKSNGITFDQFTSVMESHTHRKRLTTMDELANGAVFAASDEGSGITGTLFNLTAGMIVY